MKYDETPENTDIFGISNIRKCQRYTLRTQRRLDKAVAEDNQAKIRYFSYLLGKVSKAVKVLAVYRVCKLNDGKNTAGIDCFAISEDKEVARCQMMEILRTMDINDRPKPIRKVMIPKPNGKKRPLGIPTIRDRISQEIIRIAIEPICEFHFLPCSHGFRPKRSCHDAMVDIFVKLARKDAKKWIVEGDIKGCFDNIRHSHILNTLKLWRIGKWIITLIERMLKSGGKVGTPQGGIISPMLANVALTCLDEEIAEYGARTYTHGTNPLVRYADDFIIMAKSENEAELIKEKVRLFLKRFVGLELSEEKTHITEIHKGFNFLGFNFRRYRGKDKLIVKPAKDNIREFSLKIKETMKGCIHLSGVNLILKLKPIINGWGNYYRHCTSSKVFRRLDNNLYFRIWRWIKRKHKERGKKWSVRRYFRKWIFTDGGQYMPKLCQIPIKNFTKVRSDVRVYSMEDRDYWYEREYINAKGSIYNSYEFTKLFQVQDGNCAYCNRGISKRDIQSYSIHKHHLKPRSRGGDDKLSNLRLLHQECHRELHSRISRLEMSGYIDRGFDYLQSLSLA